jgi:hypothetical protein
MAHKAERRPKAQSTDADCGPVEASSNRAKQARCLLVCCLTYGLWAARWVGYWALLARQPSASLDSRSPSPSASSHTFAQSLGPAPPPEMVVLVVVLARGEVRWLPNLTI